MNITFSKKFQKQYKKFSNPQKKLITETLFIFEQNPNDKSLRNHALLGKFKGIRSIDVAFDIRILIQEEGNYTMVLLVSVGTHSSIYG